MSTQKSEVLEPLGMVRGDCEPLALGALNVVLGNIGTCSLPLSHLSRQITRNLYLVTQVLRPLTTKGKHMWVQAPMRVHRLHSSPALVLAATSPRPV